MSRAKGNAAAGWVAAYLRRWWPLAEKTPNGLRGIDILNTLGVAIEVKTGKQLRTAWLDQAIKNAANGDAPLLIWLREGQGEKSVPCALALLPLPLADMMGVLEDSGIAPGRDLADARAATIEAGSTS
jgi:hypothetical protein